MTNGIIDVRFSKRIIYLFDSDFFFFTIAYPLSENMRTYISLDLERESVVFYGIN